MRLLLALTVAFVAGHPLYAHAASVDGVHVHWTSRGAGPQTVILVHCWTCDGTTWSAQVPSLSRRYRVITLDLPGHGRSGTPAAFSMDLFVRAIDAVRAEAGADRVVVAGHGNGAVVVRRYALTHPARVAGLVVVDGNFLLDDNGVASETTLRAAGDRVVREKAIRNLFHETTPPDLQQRLLQMMLAMPDAVAADSLVAIQGRPEWTNTPVRIPVLAVYSEHLGVATAPGRGVERAVKAMYPMAEYHRIADTGHFVMAEAPEAFNLLVDRFLSRMSAPND